MRRRVQKWKSRKYWENRISVWNWGNSVLTHCSWVWLLQHFNYKVFLLCSVITLSVYLLLIKTDGTTSKIFHVIALHIFCWWNTVYIFCYALNFWNVINFGHIFSSSTSHYSYWTIGWPKNHGNFYTDYTHINIYLYALNFLTIVVLKLFQRRYVKTICIRHYQNHHPNVRLTEKSTRNIIWQQCFGITTCKFVFY